MKLTHRNVSTINTIYEKIVIEFGFSKYYTGVPDFTVICDDNEEIIDGEVKEIYGEFDGEQNIIILNIKPHPTMREIIRTMLHEYKHYLQRPSWYTRYSNMGHSYTTNPYETQAWEFADEHIHKFIKKRQVK